MSDDRPDQRSTDPRFQDPSPEHGGHRREEERVDPDAGTRSFAESAREFFDRRLVFILLFGIASGYPWVLVTSAMTLRLAQADLSLSAIGLFGSVTAVYAINFFWAPFVDRLMIPVLGRLLGPRRGWILTMQIIMLLGTVAIAFADPLNDLALLSLSALVVATASATQDVAVDAYRIEVIPRHETAKISHAAAMTTAGWWIGFGLVGSIPFFLIDLEGLDWTLVYLVLAALWLPLMGVVLLAPRAPQKRDRFAEAEAEYREALGDVERPTFAKKAAAWTFVTLLEPLREFVGRVGARLAVSLLLFVFLFKIGEAFLGRMSIAFYKDIGFTATQMGIWSKLAGGTVTAVFAIGGSLVNARFGLIRGLVIGGIAMAGSNLMYAWMALAGPVEWLYAVTVIVDSFTAALSTVAFVAFISYLTSHTFTATQYALFASLGNFSRTTTSSASGFVVDALGGNWSLFFVITALMVIPSLLLLIYVRKQLYRKQAQWEEEEARPTPR